MDPFAIKWDLAPFLCATAIISTPPGLFLPFFTNTAPDAYPNYSSLVARITTDSSKSNTEQHGKTLQEGNVP